MQVKAEAAATLEVRLEGWPWSEINNSLDQYGYAVTPRLISPEQAVELRELYCDDKPFRSRVVMERLRFGRGDYKYFAYPLPPVVQQLRTELYPRLANVANRWAEFLGDETLFPATLAEFLEQCHRAGQTRPTPLILHYEKDGYNCLHQDIYGAVAFPLQAVIMLGQHGRDWLGGEFSLVEQRPRAQSAVHVATADEGCGVIFTTRYRPVRCTNGYYRVTMRHGIARVHSGSRYTLGIIFHDGE